VHRRRDAWRYLDGAATQLLLATGGFRRAHPVVAAAVRPAATLDVSVGVE
jgi:hypothetical protein